MVLEGGSIPPASTKTLCSYSQISYNHVHMLTLFAALLGAGLTIALSMRWIHQAKFRLDDPAAYPALLKRLKRLALGSGLLKMVCLFVSGDLQRWQQALGAIEPTVIFSFTALGLAQMLEWGILLYHLYPLERYARSLQASRADFLQFRIGLIAEQFAPLLAALTGALFVVFLASEHIRQTPYGIYYAIAMGAQVLLLSLFFRKRSLLLAARQAPLPFPNLLQEVQAMGRSLGVQVREIVILDGAKLRVANAFAVGSDRVAITDYLLLELTEQETLAVLAHEVRHLAQRKRAVKLWLLELGAVIALAIAVAPWLKAWRLETQLLLLPPLLWLALYPLNRLRRQNEIDADRFAVSRYGAEPLQSALLKVAQLNQTWGRKRGKRKIHLDLEERLSLIAAWEPVE